MNATFYSIDLFSVDKKGEFGKLTARLTGKFETMHETSLKPGDKAPEFTGTDQEGRTIRLKDFKDKTLVLFFYPRDGTPTCTVEACNLRDHYADLKKSGFEVVGVSADSEKKHLSFAGKHQLPYSLIADTEMEIIRAYDVWGPKKFMGREFDGIVRTTFLIRNGKIVRVIKKVKSAMHAEQIVEEEVV